MAFNSNFVSHHIGRHKLVFLLIIITGFVNSCLTFLIPVSIGEFFYLEFQTGGGKAQLLNYLGISVNALEDFFVLFLILLFLKCAVSYLEELMVSRLSELFVKELREQVFAAQIKSQSENLARGKYGKYLLRYSNDMKAVQNYFSKGILEGIKTALFLSTGIFVLYRINFPITIIFLFGLVVVGAAVIALAGAQKPFIKSSRSSRSSLLAYVSRSFKDYHKIKSAGSEESSLERFNFRSTELYRKNMRNNYFESGMHALIPFFLFAVIGCMLWHISKPNTGFTASSSFIVVLILLMMQGTLRRLLKVPGYYIKGKVSMYKIKELLEEKIPQNQRGTLQT